MNNIGEKINTEKLGCRNFNPSVTRQQLALNKLKFICWGAKKWIVDKIDKFKECTWMRFYVSGMNFKGYIYIELNGADLYNIYYCSTHGTIKDTKSDIYGDMICDVIDAKIEKQENYSF
jgi:hypothetical protein